MRNNTIFCSVLVVLMAFLGSSCQTPHPKTQLHFGIFAAQNDLWDESIYRWKKVIEATPQSAAAHNNLAVAYEKKGLWEQARNEYETALKLDPKNEHIQANFNKFKEIHDKKQKEEKDEKN